MSQIYQTPPGLKASGCQEIKHISTSTKIESIECVSLPRTYQLKRYQASVHFILVTKRPRQDPFSCQKSTNKQRRHSEPLLDRGRWKSHPLPHTTHHNHTPHTMHHIPLAHPTPHHIILYLNWRSPTFRCAPLTAWGSHQSNNKYQRKVFTILEKNTLKKRRLKIQQKQSHTNNPLVFFNEYFLLFMMLMLSFFCVGKPMSIGVCCLLANKTKATSNLKDLITSNTSQMQSDKRIKENGTKFHEFTIRDVSKQWKRKHPS